MKFIRRMEIVVDITNELLEDVMEDNKDIMCNGILNEDELYHYLCGLGNDELLYWFIDSYDDVTEFFEK